VVETTDLKDSVHPKNKILFADLFINCYFLISKYKRAKRLNNITCKGMGSRLTHAR